MSSRFAAVRVRASHRDYWRSTQRDEEWLLIEWPQGDPKPAKYWLSTLPNVTSLQRLVNVAKMRWRIERDYQDLKQEFGLGHFEERSWRGFHHHASLCIAAYGFLVTQRLIQGAGKKNFAVGSFFTLPDDYVPRGSPARPTARG
ncbi:SRSO17 transposase [Paraburkholderia sp. UCT70]